MSTNASGTTANYGLSQWAASDGVCREDFNADNLAIDTALASAAALAGSRAQIATGNYVGTGGHGSGSPNTLTFDFAPKLVFVCMADMGAVFGSTAYLEKTYTFMAIRPAESVSVVTTYGAQLMLSWTESSLSWYVSSNPFGSSDPTAVSQFNQTGTTYYYLAIG